MPVMFFSSHHFSYVGRLFVKATGKPGEILGKLKELAGYAADDEIELYEVSCASCYSFIDSLFLTTVFWEASPVTD